MSEPFNEWTVGGGLLYWAQRCFVVPFRNWSLADYYLRRKPTGGGDTRTLATPDADNCETFLHMAADDSGIYYYNGEDNSIEMVATSSPDDPPVVVADSAWVGHSLTAGLELDESYLYYASRGAIHRFAKDGRNKGRVLVDFASIPYPSDLIVDETSVYWLDERGLWWASKDCADLPCDEEKLSSISGNYLLLSGRGFAGEPRPVYWVETGSDPQRIRRLVCTPGYPCGTQILYTAVSGWHIGQLVAARIGSGQGDSHLLWTETDYASEGRVRRMPISGGAAADIAITSSSIDRRLFKDQLGLYFADREPGNNAISRLPFDASAIERDLSAEAWEVTQAIQNLVNDVPLVANKTTYVRVYGGEVIGPQVNSAEAWLVGMRGGVPLPKSPLQPINGVQALAASSTYDRANADDGWLFKLPNSWTDAGTTMLQAVVDPREVYADPNRANNTLSRTLAFHDEPDACLFFSPVRTHAPLPSYTDPNFWETIDRLTSLWPVPATRVMWFGEPIEELETCWWGPVPYPCSEPYELDQGWDWDNWGSDATRVIAKLILRQALAVVEAAFVCEEGASVHSVGMVHPDSNTGSLGGLANLYINASWVKFPSLTSTPGYLAWDWPHEGSVLAHELTHNFNRGHVDCPPGKPDHIDDNFTYDEHCKLDDRPPSAETTHFGFDSISRTSVAPYLAADFMSYAGHTWVSDYTYKAVMGEFGTLAAAAGPTSAAGRELAASNDVVLAAGGFEPDLCQGQLEYAYVVPTSELGPTILQEWQMLAASQWDGSEADVHLRLTDAAGNVLDDRAVTQLPSIEQGAEHQVDVFVTAFPAPAGTVARIELMADEDVLDVLEPGTGQPSITVLAPGAGDTIDANLTIRWSASDPDGGDILLYNVHYSPDQGDNWFPLASNYPGTPTSTTVALTLTDPATLPGSDGQNALIRIMASDGYNTGLAISAPFTVVERPPHAFITTPRGQQWASAGETVALRGVALDAEDGSVDDGDFYWTVGGVANGTGREQDAVGFAPGSYPVQLRVTDSDGQQGTAQSTLNISPLHIPAGNAAPTLDGWCDDEAYGDGKALQLAPYSDSTQATVHLQLAEDALWACFTGLDRGSSNPGTFVALRIDVDNSQDTLAQWDDYGFFVGEDGTPFTMAGDGLGGFGGPGPGGVSARVTATDAVWRAELRIDAAVLGDSSHAVRIAPGHYGVTVEGDDYQWPYLAAANQPPTWALTALGDWPQMEGITPGEAPVGSAALTLTVTGTHLVDGTVVYWDEIPLPTTVMSSSQLTAEIAATRLATAATFEVAVVAPGLEDAPSQPQLFTVKNPLPVITGLSPDAVSMGAPAFALTVEGAGFVEGAVILWDGIERPTTFVNATQLQAAVGATDLVPARTVGIRVRNPSPGGGGSNTEMFAIQAPGGLRVFLPLIAK